MIFSSMVSLFVFSNHSFQFYISFTNLILWILLIRWGYLGILPYAVNQIVLSIVQIQCFDVATATALSVNLCSILFVGVLVVFLKNQEDIRNRPLTLVLSFLVLYMLIALGRALGMILIGDYKFIAHFVFYLINQELFSIVIGVILMLLLRNIDNLLVDVKKHIIELQKEEEEVSSKEGKYGRIQEQKLRRDDFKKD